MEFASKSRQAKPVHRIRPSRLASPQKWNSSQQSEVRHILRAAGAQAKLTIGQPNDKYEQEADRVADQVMRMRDADVAQRVETGRIQPMQIQRMCPECEDEQSLQRQPEEEEEELQAKFVDERIQRQPIDEEDEEMQAKEMPSQTPQVGPGIESRINSLKGGGQPLDSATRSFFEPRFGHDFSHVRVHADSGAAETAKSVNARAYTLGSNMVFGSGEYQPQSSAGKRLLGHELTHVVQQTGAIQRYPATTPHGRAYTAGVMHDHRPSGRWAAIQSGLSCLNGATECACSLAPPRGVLMLAYLHELSGYPLAQDHLGYYARGVGTDYTESVATFIARDSGVRSKLARYIGTADRGHFKVYQSDYTDQDFRYAFGALDRLDYEVDRAAGTVHVWFVDRYEFHPVYPGFYTKKPGDAARVTNCVHAAAVELKASGAADFWMVGYGTVPLAIVTGSSSPGGGGGAL